MNHSALASDCGISQPTAKAWLSVLETSFLVFRLPAFHSNTRKRLVKMPKLHFVDTGLACWLLGAVVTSRTVAQQVATGIPDAGSAARRWRGRPVTSTC